LPHWDADCLFSSTEPDPRFNRFVTLLTALTQAHRPHWIEDPRQAGSFSVVIDHYAPAYAAEVSELLGLVGLLGLSVPKYRSPQVILPISLALHGRDTGGIGVSTRSVWDAGYRPDSPVPAFRSGRHN